MSSLYDEIESGTEVVQRRKSDFIRSISLKRFIYRISKWRNSYEYIFGNRLLQMTRDWNDLLPKKSSNYTILDFIKTEFIKNSKSREDAIAENSDRRISTCEQYANFLNELKNYIEKDKELSKDCEKTLKTCMPDFYSSAVVAKEKIETLQELEVDNNEDSSHEDVVEIVDHSKNIDLEIYVDAYVKKAPKSRPNKSKVEDVSCEIRTFIIDFLLPIVNRTLNTVDTEPGDRKIITSLITKNAVKQVGNSQTIYNKFMQRKDDKELYLYKKTTKGKHNKKTMEESFLLLKRIADEIYETIENDENLLKIAIE